MCSVVRFFLFLVRFSLHEHKIANTHYLKCLNIRLHTFSGEKLLCDILLHFKYSRTSLFRTRLIRSPRFFEGRLNSLGFTPMFSVIYYQLFRAQNFEFPAISNSSFFPYYLKSTPALFRTYQKQSTYIRAQLEAYGILFELDSRALSL